MKRSFFQAAVMLMLLYGCTTWLLTKRREKKLDGNYTRMLRAIMNKSWHQHPTRPQLYGHLHPITKTIQVRQTKHAGHCWRCRDELISDVLLWTPTYGRAKAEWPARTYIQQLCEDMGCSPEDLPEAMNNRDKWRERVRDIRASGTTWWWWFIHVFLYMFLYMYFYMYFYTCLYMYFYTCFYTCIFIHFYTCIFIHVFILTTTTTTPTHSNPGEKAKARTGDSPLWCSFVSYPEHPFEGGILLFNRGCSQCVLNPFNSAVDLSVELRGKSIGCPLEYQLNNHLFVFP